MRHFKIAHIALGTAVFGSAGAAAWLALATPQTASSSYAAPRISDIPLTANKKAERLTDPLITASSDSPNIAHNTISADREPAPSFNLPPRASSEAHLSSGAGGGGTGNGIAPLFVANAGPFSPDDGTGSGGVDLRGQNGGAGGRAGSTDSGGPGGAGPGGGGGPSGGDPGGGGSGAARAQANVMSANTVTTSGNLDVAGGFTDVVPAGGNWTIGQDLNVGSTGTGPSTLNAAGNVRISGSLNVGSPTGTNASTVYIAPTGSVAVTNEVNVFANGMLQVDGPLNGAPALKVSGGIAQINVPTTISTLALTAGQIGGTNEVLVTGTITISGDSAKALTGVIANQTSALWTGQGNILLGNGGAIDNYGTFHAQAQAAMEPASSATGSNVFFNEKNALLQIDSNAVVTMYVPVNNQGQILVENATLTLGAGPNGFTQTAITARTSAGDGGIISSADPLVFKAGYIKGSGIFRADIQNSGATLAAGASPGHLTIQGNYTQSDTAIFNEQIQGATPGTLYDVVTVQGTATSRGIAILGGTLQVTTLKGFVPSPTQSYMFLEATEIDKDTLGTIFGKQIGDSVDVMTDETETPATPPTKVGSFTLEFTTDSTTGMQELILDRFVPVTTLKPPAQVPEPASLALVGVAALSLLKRRSRR